MWWCRQHVDEHVGDVIRLYVWHITIKLLGHLFAETRIYGELRFHHTGADALKSKGINMIK